MLDERVLGVKGLTFGPYVITQKQLNNEKDSTTWSNDQQHIK